MGTFFHNSKSLLLYSQTEGICDCAKLTLSCSLMPRLCWLGSLRVLWLPPSVQRHVRLNCDSEMSVSVATSESMD